LWWWLRLLLLLMEIMRIMWNMEGIISRGERQNQGIMVVMEDIVASV
jgi:hypothetical protein